jgi:uncharacterized membrane protein YraQ (UPF0718 family)
MNAAARRIFGDKGFIVALLAAVILGTLVYVKQGGDAVRVALHADLRLFVEIGIMIPAVLLLSAVVQVMMPKGLIERWLGASSGYTGIVIATLAGALTPGGPFMAFPLVRALYRAGADWAPLIAYTTAWMMLSVMRTLVYEIPLVGVRLPAVRIAACLVLPTVAGLSARYIARVYRPPPRGLEDDDAC